MAVKGGGGDHAVPHIKQPRPPLPVPLPAWHSEKKAKPMVTWETLAGAVEGGLLVDATLVVFV